MLVLALVVVGATGYFGLGVDRYPSVDLPSINVRTMLPGAAPEEIFAADRWLQAMGLLWAVVFGLGVYVK